MKPLPQGPYGVIYADPPWQFSSRPNSNGEFYSFEDAHYTTTDRDWIRNLPVAEITADDAALFLWTTDAHIPDAIAVMKAWGFKYTTVAFVWEKITCKGRAVQNLGAWTMKSYELCLLGTRGRMRQHKASCSERQKVSALRREHSRKPDEVRQSIERLFPSLPKLELFARQRVPGWDCWGNETEKFSTRIIRKVR